MLLGPEKQDGQTMNDVRRGTKEEKTREKVVF